MDLDCAADDLFRQWIPFHHPFPFPGYPGAPAPIQFPVVSLWTLCLGGEGLAAYGQRGWTA